MEKPNLQISMENKEIPGTIDDYLSDIPDKQRSALINLRNIIHEVAPDAVEGISYQIPTFKYMGPLVGFAAFKKHCSFYLMSTAVMEAYMDKLQPYDTAKGTIHFQPDKPLPEELVKELVMARIAENRIMKEKMER